MAKKQTGDQKPSSWHKSRSHQNRAFEKDNFAIRVNHDEEPFETAMHLIRQNGSIKRGSK